MTKKYPSNTEGYRDDALDALLDELLPEALDNGDPLAEAHLARRVLAAAEENPRRRGLFARPLRLEALAWPGGLAAAFMPLVLGFASGMYVPTSSSSDDAWDAYSQLAFASPSALGAASLETGEFSALEGFSQ